MDELKNYADIFFRNPIIIDIFGKYADNSVLASFIGKDGTIRLRFRVNSDSEPPKSCEQLLSLLYALLESNPGSKLGEVYIKNQQSILRETIYRLAEVLDGFIDVRLELHFTDPETNLTKHTKCTITRTKTNK